MLQGENKIADSAPTLAILKQLPVREQALLLLKRLATLFPRGQSFSKYNLGLSAHNNADPCGMATGYPPEEVGAIQQHLLGEPWKGMMHGKPYPPSLRQRHDDDDDDRW